MDYNVIMEKFKELVSLCKGSVEISVNDHKDYYESVEQHINEEYREDIDKEVAVMCWADYQH